MAARHHYDLIVIGHHLAGLVAAALVARRDKRVLVLPGGPGNGQVRLLNQLKNRNWNDKVSSSRFAKVKISSLNEAWVELYDDNTFRDRRMVIKGPRYASRPNYKKVRVEGKKGFGDKVSSARWQIPAGYSYRLYEHDNYRGKYIDLVGDGTIREISNFKRKKFNDEVSSSKYRKTR